MRRPASILAAIAVAALAFAPALAEARPGGSGSSGSRGARTYSAPPPTNTAPNQAQPMQRTQQPAAPQQAGQAAAGAQRPAGAPARPGFGTGMMAGLLGAGLLGMLFGAGMFGGLGSFAAVLGLLLQIALIGGLVFLVVALLRRRSQPQPAGMPRQMMQDAPRSMPPGGGMAGGGAGRTRDELGVGQADLQAFEATLVEVNRAWSAEEIDALARVATPEMVQYFRDDYAALAERGWKNETRDVRLEQGDVAEAWNEGAREYCTVAMKFSMVDVTRRLADGAVVEGHPTDRQTATELWTFMRVQGGRWVLSAIQQTA